MTFTFNGFNYESNEANTHFYMTVEGKKTRIKKEDFDLALKAVEVKKSIKKSAKVKKNVVFTTVVDDTTITLTAKQKDFLESMPQDDFWEQGLESILWIDIFCDTVAGKFNAMAVGAMVSTLKEKDLIYVMTERVNGHKAKYFGLTDAGKQVAKELGLE